MTNINSHKIKQRKERLKENQTPAVAPKPKNLWFWIFTAVTASVIVYLLYLGYTNELKSELVISFIIAITVLLLLIIWYVPKFYIRSLPIETGKDFDREKEKTQT